MCACIVHAVRMRSIIASVPGFHQSISRIVNISKWRRILLWILTMTSSLTCKVSQRVWFTFRALLQSVNFEPIFRCWGGGHFSLASLSRTSPYLMQAVFPWCNCSQQWVPGADRDPTFLPLLWFTVELTPAQIWSNLRMDCRVKKT